NLLCCSLLTREGNKNGSTGKGFSVCMIKWLRCDFDPHIFLQKAIHCARRVVAERFKDVSVFALTSDEFARWERKVSQSLAGGRDRSEFFIVNSRRHWQCPT